MSNHFQIILIGFIISFSTQTIAQNQDSIFHNKGISIGEIREVNSEIVNMKILVDIKNSDFGKGSADIKIRKIPKIYDFRTKNINHISFRDTSSLIAMNWNEIKRTEEVKNAASEDTTSNDLLKIQSLENVTYPINLDFNKELALAAKYSNRSANNQIWSIVTGVIAIGTTAGYNKEMNRKIKGGNPTHEGFYKTTSIILYTASSVFFVSSVINHKKSAMHLLLASDYAGITITIPIK